MRKKVASVEIRCDAAFKKALTEIASRHYRTVSDYVRRQLLEDKDFEKTYQAKLNEETSRRRK